MRYLVTGGAGYIGSVVTTKLLDNGHDVIVVDDLCEGSEDAIDERADFYNISIGDYEKLSDVFFDNKIDVVVHLAAFANVPDSVVWPHKYYANNVVSTITLLGVMLDNGVNKIIFSSTAAVYGELGNFCAEDSPINPTNPYGRSKLMCEQIIKDHASAYGFRYTIFRYFCVAGATELHGESRVHETHLIPKVLDVALGKETELSIFGDKHATPDGTCVRDFIHVEDIADAHLLAKLDNETYNLGCDFPFSVINIVKVAEKCLGVKIPYVIKEPRDGDPDFLVASIKKAKDKLGWQPKHNIEDIITSAYKWRKNPLY
jgi:UDP-glucose 4-epimerase